MKFKRRGRSRRRTIRRKPLYKRRRIAKVKPDGMVKEKITIVEDWVASGHLGGSSTEQNANFLWMPSFESNTPDNVFALNRRNVQFDQMSRNYHFFKPYMMTIRYVPRDFIPTGTNDALIRSIESASFPYDSEQN